MKYDRFVQASKIGTMPDDDVVDLIVDIINKHTDSRKDRRSHYQKTKVTFLVDSCRNINVVEEEPKKETEKDQIKSMILIKL